MAFEPDFEAVEHIWKREALPAGDLGEMTRRAMRRLNVKQAQALNLVAVAGMTPGQAAAVCGCAEVTMKSRIARAGKTLGSLLAEGGGPNARRLSPTALRFMVAEAFRACTSGGRRGIYKF